MCIYIYIIYISIYNIYIYIQFYIGKASGKGGRGGSGSSGELGAPAVELVGAAVDVCVLRSIIEGLSLGVPTVLHAPLAPAAQGPAQQQQQLGAAPQEKSNEGTKIGEKEKKTGGGGEVSAATAARALALAAEIGALGLLAFAVY